MGVILRSSIRCPWWPFDVSLDDIEEADPALRNRAWRHGKLPGSKPGYLLNNHPRISTSMDSEWNETYTHRVELSD